MGFHPDSAGGHHTADAFRAINDRVEIHRYAHKVVRQLL
jgi:hypothetical protein